MDVLLQALVPALIGAVVAFIGALYSNALERRTKIDESLRDKRIDLYQKLWAKTKLLPKWPRSSDVTYEQLFGLSEELRDWYFDEGGIYLSAKARAVYGDLQDAIGAVLQGHKSGPVSDLDYASVRAKCSALRTELTTDLLSRRRAFLIL